MSAVRLERTREALEWANGDLFHPKGVDAGDVALAELEQAEAVIAAAQRAVSVTRFPPESAMQPLAAALAAFGSGEGDTA